MESLLASEERRHFSERLGLALDNAGCARAPAQFLYEFNLRADGAAVTVYAVRKWLDGDAFPTQARLHVLALWLGVSPAWLRYGEEELEGAPVALADAGMPRLLAADRVLLADIQTLDARGRVLVRTLVDTLLLTHP